MNGQPVTSPNQQVRTEGDTHRLHIPQATAQDAGRFAVMAENPSGKATCSARLEVEQPVVPQKLPRIDSQPQPMYTDQTLSGYDSET